MGELTGRVWKDPVWSAVIAGGVLAGCAAAFRYIQSSPLPVYRLDFLSRNFSAVSLIGFGSLICIAGMVPLLEGVNGMGKKVSWNFDGHLGLVGNGKQISIMSLQFSGTNIQDRPIEKISGFVRSLITN